MNLIHLFRLLSKQFKKINSSNKENYKPLESASFTLPGPTIMSEMLDILNELKDKKVIGDHGIEVGKKLGYMLSGGEKRRVAIARALMQKPDILLADEIVSELDSVTARDVMDVIHDAQKKLNLTAVMIHHDINLALEYANRVAVIKEGEKILEIGVEGERIVDFQTGNLSQEEILEMYDEPQE